MHLKICRWSYTYGQTLFAIGHIIRDRWSIKEWDFSEKQPN